MAEWAAANLSSSSFYDSEEDDMKIGSDDNLSLEQHPHQQHQNKIKNKLKRRRLSETPEAAIARLTTAYNAAMAAVRALHKASNKIIKDRRKKRSKKVSVDGDGNDNDDTAMLDVDKEENEAGTSDMDVDGLTTGCTSENEQHLNVKEIESLRRGALAARNAFENALLSDSLIVTYAPTLVKTMQKMKKGSKFVPSPASISSDAHKITVKQLAYLTLMNYADLVLSCTYYPNEESHQDILDRGVVRVLDIFLTQSEKYSFWSDDENEEQSRRLALVSYCDAVDLDDSDPTSWMKLACCARSVGRVIQQKSYPNCLHENTDHDEPINQEMITNQRIDKLNYHRLERFALERGLTVLRPGIPCNRLIARAFKQFEQKLFSDEIKPYMTKQEQTDQVHDECVIDLPRDSWSTLGRLLLKAYKSEQNSILRLKISPMLTLSPSILGLICEYLGLYNTDEKGGVGNEVKNLEATCRALSVNILSARTKIEKNREIRMKRLEQEMHELLENENKDAKANKDVTEKASDDSGMIHYDEKNLRVKRISTRVQSQLISSGKQAERSAKRRSVEYCFTCAVIPCTTDHPSYSTLVREDFKWEKLALLSSTADTKRRVLGLDQSTTQPVVDIETKGPPSSRVSTVNKALYKPTVECSINGFISRWGDSNSSSNEMLYNFLCHVSCFIDDVCHYEQDMSLISCIIESYELLVDTSASTSNGLLPCWFGDLEFPSNEDRNITVAIETLAINLLYAELQMRTGELHGNDYGTTFSDKIDKVKRMIPYLLKYASSLGESEVPMKHSSFITNLQVRTQWLVSIFFMFWSKRTYKMADEKEAEKLALQYIDSTIRSFKRLNTTDNPTISTPQLLSPARFGGYWKELSVGNLKVFRDELEAYSVLSRCRRNFFDQLAEWKKSGFTSTADLSPEQKRELKTISSELFKRYSVGTKKMDISERSDELIDDFFLSNVANLTPTIENDESNYQQMWPDAWNSIPISNDTILFEDLSNSSYVTMMSLALLYGDESQLHLASFLGSLLLAVKRIHANVFTKPTLNEMDAKEDSVDDDSEDGLLVGNGNDSFATTVEKISVLTHLAHLLLSKLYKLVQSAVQKDSFEKIIESIDVILITHFMIQLSSGHNLQSPGSSTNSKILTTIPADLNLLKSTLDFASFVRTHVSGEDLRQKLESSIFVELCKTFVCEREVMSTLSSKPDRNVNRFEYEKRSLSRSKFVSLIASELTGLLLSHPNKYGESCIKESFLVESLIKMDGFTTCQNNLTLYPLLKVMQVLTWFWNMISTKKSKSADCLRIPIAALVIAILGSSGHAHSASVLTAFSNVNVEKHSVGGPSDYFDSDDSTNGVVDNEMIEISGVGIRYSRKTLLYSLCRCVQCIGLVFSACEDSEMLQTATFHLSQSWKGNFLPFVVVRVLGGIADFILNEFSGINAKDRVWAEDYPFGFRGSGAQLDALLHKAYRCLHGISLSAQNNNLSPSRGYAIPSVTQVAPLTSMNSNFVPPESILASSRLYRCIMRAYAGGRRTIPQGALECVLSAIPSDTENESFKVIKNFLFQSPSSDFLQYEGDTSNIHVCQAINMDAIARKIPDCLLNEEQIASDVDIDDDALRVRRGVCKYFAEGPLPSLGSSEFSPKQDESKTVKEREIASDAEKAVCKKFMFIIESLQYEPYDASKWYRAGLCLEVKIHIIMDRLKQSRQVYIADDFYVKKCRNSHEREMKFRTMDHDSLTLNELIGHQYSEYKKNFVQKEDLFGEDVSFYLKNQWSCFSSLKGMSLDVGRRLRQKPNSQDLSHWCSIQSKFDGGDFAEWQALWGKKFLIALQSMREKCFNVAFYLSLKQDIAKKGNLHPEIAESLGTMYYSDMGFQSKMTPFEVREQAKLAQSFFERALSSMLQAEGDDDLAEYELQVMIGKCQEKIAQTLQSEAFSSTHLRKFEITMEKSLECYDKALEAAKKYEEESGALECQGGGSAHGIIELIYRLHASRLKVLLKAVRKSKDERNMAEIEALKLTEVYWHDRSNDTNVERKVKDTRERIWAVLSDIVECMVYCRREQTFFHRSVYRHAQALLWAPLFHDPDGSIKEGSNATVPAYKSYKLRGLSSGSCAASAEAILNSLFDKKRPQLCAVWVTTPQSPSPFEYMNDSSRKFDRLRWKYIGAFVDCMRICGRRSTLETFIKWCFNSSRDLPSFYIATAKQEGEAPQNSHDTENMLLNDGNGLIYFAMQYANGAIADIIRRESIALSHQKLGDDWEKKVYELMSDAYKCFLRLNCSIDDSVWQTRRVKQRMSSRQIPEVEALCVAYMTLKRIPSASYSKILKHCPWDHKVLLLRSAIKDCEKMFPATALKATSQCQKRKRKQKDPVAKDSTKKHKDEESTTQRKLVVHVPKSVKEGEKFIVEVCCEYFRQRVQLVSSGSKRIIFHLNIPKNITSDVDIQFVNN